MRLRTWLAALVGTAALSCIAAPAQAAPVGALHGFSAPAVQASGVAKVHWYRRHHHRYYYRPYYRHWRHRHYYAPWHHRRWHHRHHRYWRHRHW